MTTEIGKRKGNEIKITYFYGGIMSKRLIAWGSLLAMPMSLLVGLAVVRVSERGINISLPWNPTLLDIVAGTVVLVMWAILVFVGRRRNVAPLIFIQIIGIFIAPVPAVISYAITGELFNLVVWGAYYVLGFTVIRCGTRRRKVFMQVV